MTAIDPEYIVYGKLAGMALGFTVTIAIPTWWKYHSYIDKRFREKRELMDKIEAKKADKEDLKRALDHIERLYEKAEHDRERVREYHERALERIDATAQSLRVLIINGGRNHRE